MECLACAWPVLGFRWISWGDGGGRPGGGYAPLRTPPPGGRLSKGGDGGGRPGGGYAPPGPPRRVAASQKHRPGTGQALHSTGQAQARHSTPLFFQARQSNPVT